MTLTVATFNVENLLSTVPSFGEGGTPRPDGPLRFLKRDRLTAPDAAAEALHVLEAHETRKLTALAIAVLDADVVCLQEVESEPVLRQFRNEYLDPLTDGAFKHLKLIEGNDGRGIDVALLSRLPLENVRSHADLRYCDVPGAFDDALARTVDRFKRDKGDPGRLRYPSPDDLVFRRGLLTADVEVGGVKVAIYTAHLKSAGTTMEPSFATDRAYTAPLRRAEALAVAGVLRSRYGDGLGDALYLVCGDFNDAAHVDGVPVSRETMSIAPLLDPALGANLIEDLLPTERWTHWWAEEGRFSQIDYILASPALRRANPMTTPRVERRGMPWRMPWRSGADAAPAGPRWVTGRLDRPAALALALDGLERFPGVGFDRPRASDHAPVVVTLEIPGT
jgi:endonuclease/exonuclease/phosphatase family metal-dependent hydrolase